MVTVSGRYSRASVALRDRLGTALDGKHVFTCLNPSLGVTFDVSEHLTAYASYGESNRAPSPIELTCAAENAPCRLPNAFVANPPLEQVVASTVEAGVHGGARFVRWHAGAFATRNEDDIVFVSAGPLTNDGYFHYVGQTRRAAPASSSRRAASASG